MYSITKFFEKVNIVHGGCFEWQGCMKPNGYGYVKLNNPRRGGYPHRVAYEMFVGPIPEGLFVCHRCDNRRCCNPSHLFLGTPKENLDDASRKRRMEHGSGRYNAKLNEEQVAIIRSLKGQVPQKELAARFGVSQSAIANVHSGTRWRHVT